MAYDRQIETDIDTVISGWEQVEKKKMFGGVGYLLKGNMAFGIHKDFLIVRMDKEQGAQSLKDPDVQLFEITGRPMAGWIMVKEPGWSRQAALGKWINVGKQFALSLPEIVILRKVLKPRLIATFVGVVATGILIVGFVFNAVL